MAVNQIQMAASPGRLLNGDAVRRISPSAKCQGKTLRLQKKNIKIATWNVRSLYQGGKLANVTQEMKRLHIGILGMSEVRWPGTGHFTSDEWVVYYSGSNDTRNQYGVGIILPKEVNKSVINFMPVSDRVLLIQLKSNFNLVSIIQVYAPTADHEESEIEEFYGQVQEALRVPKSNEVTIVMGDFNAKIGQGKVEQCVGGFGLGNRNERGDRLVEFCMEENFVVANTLFKLPPRRLYTWQSPADRSDHIVRNQIDYILVKQKFRNGIKSAKTYPGADINSDHNPVVVEMRLRLKRARRSEPRKRIDIRKLKVPDCRDEASICINKTMVEDLRDQSTGVESKWKSFKRAVKETQESCIGYVNHVKKKPWVTDEILELMGERRKFKGRDPQRYKAIHKQIRRDLRVAKSAWLEDRCKEIEEAQEKHDAFRMHKLIRELTSKHMGKAPVGIKMKDGTIVFELEEKLKRWAEYIQELFDDTRNSEGFSWAAEDGLEIQASEVEYAVRNSKDGKAVGEDEIHAETLKLLGEDGVRTLVRLFNAIYKTGDLPVDWLRSTFIPLPKVSRATDCSDYRTISLMSHVLKVFLKIIHGRIYRKLEDGIGDTQFGFRNGFGTREALFAYNVIVQRCLDMNVDVYMCFVDYAKAFDRVRHDVLVNILESKNIDRWDLRIIRNLYYNQQAVLKLDCSNTEEIVIKRGVRQGCILSPLLFNVYSEHIIQEALYEDSAGIKINGRNINNIRYADDTVILADNEEDLQKMLDNVNSISEKYGLAINIKKTKVMMVSREMKQVNVFVNQHKLEQVDHYKYLGTRVSNASDNDQEVKIRIEQARSVFVRMKKFLTSSDITIELRIRALRCYVFSVLLYGMEGWTLKARTMKRLRSFEMWCYRRILKISWVQKVTNVQVLERLNKQCELENCVKIRKLKYLGHLMRNDKYEILRLIMQGRICGKRKVGRRKKSWLGDLREWYGRTSQNLFRDCASRVKLAIMITNLLKEKV